MSTHTQALSTDAIDSKPRSFSWDISTMEGFAEGPDGITWRFWEAVEADNGDTAECALCGDTIVYHDDEWFHEATLLAALDEDADYGHEPEPEPGYGRDKGAEGPMMSYWYPVEIRYPQEAAAKIAHLPLCVVEVDGETGLALTGGGMDLSWQIAEAFIAIGAYPPFHFASNLPKMADGWTDTHALVLAACRESCRVMASWAARGAEKCDEVEAWYMDREAAKN